MYLAEINMVVSMLLGTVYSKGFMDNFLKCGELESYGLKETMASLLLSPVPERPIGANTGLKFLFHFCILPSYVLLRVTFCAIITASRRKGSTIFFKLKLHVLR